MKKAHATAAKVATKNDRLATLRGEWMLAKFRIAEANKSLRDAIETTAFAIDDFEKAIVRAQKGGAK